MANLGDPQQGRAIRVKNTFIDVDEDQGQQASQLPRSSSMPSISRWLWWSSPQQDDFDNPPEGQGSASSGSGGPASPQQDDFDTAAEGQGSASSGSGGPANPQQDDFDTSAEGQGSASSASGGPARPQQDDFDTPPEGQGSASSGSGGPASSSTSPVGIPEYEKCKGRSCRKRWCRNKLQKDVRRCLTRGHGDKEHCHDSKTHSHFFPEVLTGARRKLLQNLEELFLDCELPMEEETRDNLRKMIDDLRRLVDQVAKDGRNRGSDLTCLVLPLWIVVNFLEADAPARFRERKASLRKSWEELFESSYAPPRALCLVPSRPPGGRRMVQQDVLLLKQTMHVVVRHELEAFKQELQKGGFDIVLVAGHAEELQGPQGHKLHVCDPPCTEQALLEGLRNAPGVQLFLLNFCFSRAVGAQLKAHVWDHIGRIGDNAAHKALEKVIGRLKGRKLDAEAIQRALAPEHPRWPRWIGPLAVILLRMLYVTLAPSRRPNVSIKDFDVAIGSNSSLNDDATCLIEREQFEQLGMTDPAKLQAGSRVLLHEVKTKSNCDQAKEVADALTRNMLALPPLPPWDAVHSLPQARQADEAARVQVLDALASEAFECQHNVSEARRFVLEGAELMGRSPHITDDAAFKNAWLTNMMQHAESVLCSQDAPLCERFLRQLIEELPLVFHEGSGPTMLIWSAHTRLATALRFQYKPKEALECLERGLAVLHGANDIHRWIGLTSMQMSLMKLDMNDLSGALADVTLFASIQAAIGDSIVGANIILAEIYSKLGDWNKTGSLLQEIQPHVPSIGGHAANSKVRYHKVLGDFLHHHSSQGFCREWDLAISTAHKINRVLFQFTRRELQGAIDRACVPVRMV